MPKTVEDILTAMNTIIEGADNRSLTDDEVVNYENLEKELEKTRKETEIRARNAAYNTPANGAPVLVGDMSTKDQYEDYNKAFNHYLRTGKPNSDLVMGPKMAQETGTDSEGGFLVSPQFRQKLVEVRKAFGGLAADVDSFSTARGGTLEYPSLDDTANQGDITAEEAAVASGADLAFGTVALGAFKYTSAGAGTNLPLRVSVELVQDAEFDIEALVARALGTRIQRKQAKDWVTGTGTTLPFGVVGAVTQDVTLATNDTIVYQDLLDMDTALDPAYEQNAKWYFNKGTWSAIRGIVDTTGRPIVMPQAESGAGGAPSKTLLGYPVVLDQGFPVHTAQDADFAILGDAREAYVIRRVAPFTLVVDPFTRAVNGQIQYHAWERADGNIQNRSAYAVLANQNVV